MYYNYNTSQIGPACVKRSITTHGQWLLYWTVQLLSVEKSPLLKKIFKESTRAFHFFFSLVLLLLLSRFSHVWLCATPETAAHQAPPSLVPGILQARTLEWVAISFSSAWNWKVKVRVTYIVPFESATQHRSHV